MNTTNLNSFGLSDQGHVRDRNEDQFLIADLKKAMCVSQSSLTTNGNEPIFGMPQGQILVVADGVGGAAHGDLASEMAVGGITDYILNFMPWFFGLALGHEDDLKDELRTAILRSESAIEQTAAEQPLAGKMGTTVTLAFVQWPRLYVVHAGDSRLYVLRHAQLWQVTRDHTIGQAMVDEGVMSAQTAESSRLSETLWNAVGSASDGAVQPDVFRVDLLMDDSLLLCTDGLTKHVTDQEIGSLLGATLTEEEVAEELLLRALHAGGSDNVTVIVARPILQTNGESQ